MLNVLSQGKKRVGFALNAGKSIQPGPFAAAD